MILPALPGNIAKGPLWFQFDCSKGQMVIMTTARGAIAKIPLKTASQHIGRFHELCHDNDSKIYLHLLSAIQGYSGPFSSNNCWLIHGEQCS